MMLYRSVTKVNQAVLDNRNNIPKMWLWVLEFVYNNEYEFFCLLLD